MTRVVRFHQYGGPEVLRIEEVKLAPLGKDEVRIRVKALGLNRAEALMRAGRYIEHPSLPAGLGLEASGIVESVGATVHAFAPGDPVSVVPPISMSAYPAYGELATFPLDHIVRHPDSLDWEAAAALWMPYLTAYGALIDIARLREGERLAITAASSSVGLAAIQIANRVGATPIAITRGETKMQALRDAGAAYVVVLEKGNVQGQLDGIAGPDAIRVVLDAVGGPMVETLASAMAPEGILFSYGGISSEPTPFPVDIALEKSLLFRGYLVHEIVSDPVRLAKAKDFIVEGIEAGALRPVVAATFPFEQIVEAHRFLETGDQFGKIVVTV